MPREAVRFSIDYSHSVTVMPITRFARWAEELGYDGITMGGSGVAGTGIDPMVVLSQVAAVTERLLLSTSVYLLSFVHPLILGQQVATLDYLSRGRVILGVGVGGERPWQFKNLSTPFGDRGVRADEAIEVLKGLWTQPSLTYHGKVFNIENVSLSIRPAQKPHPPIWVGGRLGGIQIGLDGDQGFKSRTAAMHRAARYGDGWFPYLTDPETYGRSVQQIKRYGQENGRDIKDGSFTWAHNLFWSVGDDHDEALAAAAAGNPFGQHRKEFSARYDIAGTPQDCIKRLREYVDSGVTHFICKPYFPPDKVLNQVERIAKEVVPYFK
ncbi:MAG: LLM class flavin-dependent oxidoreductase [Chloroflexi bacterium]|nr:LLM class flavin-dependent oxidoreductase [Chloroflexota bacterium]